jgi:hypothetical protein
MKSVAQCPYAGRDGLLHRQSYIGRSSEVPSQLRMKGFERIANRNDGRLHGRRRAGKNNAIGITRARSMRLPPANEPSFLPCTRRFAQSSWCSKLRNQCDLRSEPTGAPHPASETVVLEFVQRRMGCKANARHFDRRRIQRKAHATPRRIVMRAQTAPPPTRRKPATELGGGGAVRYRKTRLNGCLKCHAPNGCSIFCKCCGAIVGR